MVKKCPKCNARYNFIDDILPDRLMCVECGFNVDVGDDEDVQEPVYCDIKEVAKMIFVAMDITRDKNFYAFGLNGVNTL